MNKANKKKFLGIVQSVAPTIATALGGPLAGAAVQEISKRLLGKSDGTMDEVESAVIGADPDMLLKLKDAEYEFKLKMKELDVAEDRLAYEDIKSARDRHVAVRDKTPAVLSYIATSLWLLILTALFFVDDLPILQTSERMQILMYILGATSALVSMAYSFYLGSSSGSAEKSKTINTIVANVKEDK